MPLSALSRSIEGNIAFITGAASGMGAATARLFADQGARLALVDVNEAGLQAVVDEIAAAGCEVRGWTLDLSDAAAIKDTINTVAEHFGGIDLLVNNAGISIFSPVDGEEYEDAWTKTLEARGFELVPITVLAQGSQ